MPLNSFQTSGNSPGAPRPGSPARCRVGILGFGTVGSAIARRLTGPDSASSLQLTHICDRRAREKRARQPEALAQGLVWTDAFDDLLASDVEIVVEAVVGAEPAVDYVRGTLLAGKSVVTANKQVIAHHGPALLTLAERQGRQLRFEASVGGVAWVAPTFVPGHSVFARTVGPQNAAVITGAHAGDITLTAVGAGGEATAVAAIGDLIAIARDRAAIVPAPVLREPAEIRGLTDRKLAEAV